MSRANTSVHYSDCAAIYGYEGSINRCSFYLQEWQLTRLCEKSDNTMSHSGHGFRRGAATFAAKLQLDNSVIQMDYWSRFAFTRSIKAVSFSVSLTAQHRFLWLVLCRYVDISYDCGTSYIIYQEVSYRDNCCMGEGKVPPGRSDHEI